MTVTIGEANEGCAFAILNRGSDINSEMHKLAPWCNSNQAELFAILKTLQRMEIEVKKREILKPT